MKHRGVVLAGGVVAFFFFATVAVGGGGGPAPGEPTRAELSIVLVLDPTFVLDESTAGDLGWLDELIEEMYPSSPPTKEFGLLIGQAGTSGGGGFVQHDFGGEMWGSAEELTGALDAYTSTAGSTREGIDGVLGIKQAAELDWDPAAGNSRRVIILVTDAPPVDWGGGAPESLEWNRTVNVVVPHGFGDSAGNTGMGCYYPAEEPWTIVPSVLELEDHQGYAVESEGFSVVFDGGPTSGDAAVRAQYVGYAELTNGSAWSIGFRHGRGR
jgi:hypothetical protein